MQALSWSKELAVCNQMQWEIKGMFVFAQNLWCHAYAWQNVYILLFYISMNTYCSLTKKSVTGLTMFPCLCSNLWKMTVFRIDFGHDWMSFSFRDNKTLNVGAQLKISICLAKCNAVSMLSKTIMNSLSGSSTCSYSLGIWHFFRKVLNLNGLWNTVQKTVVIIYILLGSLHCWMCTVNPYHIWVIGKLFSCW